MTKKINKNLTVEQKLVLFEEGTEAPGTSLLNNEKERDLFIVLTVKRDCLIPKLNMKVGQVGHLFTNLYQMYLKQKQTTCWVILE